MRCNCNTGGTPRYIVLLNSQQLRGNNETTQEPPEPLKICAFYHSVTRPRDFLYGTAYYRCGFILGWDKDFANPTIPWTLPISETDKFDEHEEWITTQTIMMLEYLIGSLWGLNWIQPRICCRASSSALWSHLYGFQLRHLLRYQIKRRNLDRSVFDVLRTCCQNCRWLHRLLDMCVSLSLLRFYLGRSQFV